MTSPPPPQSFKNWLAERILAHDSKLDALDRKVSILMATVEELQTALDANTAANKAAVDGINKEIQQLKDAVAALSTSKPPTQAQIDQLHASTSALASATAALAADDPAPQPAPQPPAPTP